MEKRKLKNDLIEYIGIDNIVYKKLVSMKGPRSTPIHDYVKFMKVLL